MAISCDYCGEHDSFQNCPYNAVAYGHIEDCNWNQQQNPSWYDRQAQNLFCQDNFVDADMPWQYSPQQELPNSMDVESARLDALLRDAT
ncbi:hypothetical protein GQ457_09G016530 [Hibiscus cannabinus]